jgi:hypothetical protein
VTGPLLRAVLAHVGALTPSGAVEVRFASGVVTREDALVIAVPPTADEQHAIAHGVYRALLDLAGRPAPRRWWKGFR